MSEAIGIVDPMEVMEYNQIAWYLEMIGDRLNSISKSIIAIEEKRTDDEEELFERLSQIGLIVYTMFDQAMKSVFDGDMKVASDAVDLYDAVGHEEASLLKEFQEKHDPELSAHVNQIAWELRIIAEYSTAIATVSIDKVLWGKNEICTVLEKE